MSQKRTAKDTNSIGQSEAGDATRLDKSGKHGDGEAGTEQSGWEDAPGTASGSRMRAEMTAVVLTCRGWKDATGTVGNSIDQSDLGGAASGSSGRERAGRIGGWRGAISEDESVRGRCGNSETGPVGMI